MTELSVPALFIAGLAASPHCSLMCGPLQLTQLRRGPGSSGAGWLHAGRIAGYAMLGAVAGTVGAQLVLWLPPLQPGIWLRVAAALLMCVIGLGLLRGTPARACARRSCTPARPGKTLLRGLTWALLPCGMLYSALLLAMLSSSAATGAALMAAFGLGTLPLSLGTALALRRLSVPAHTLRFWAAASLIALGGLSLLALVATDDVVAWCRTVLA